MWQLSTVFRFVQEVTDVRVAPVSREKPGEVANGAVGSGSLLVCEALAVYSFIELVFALALAAAVGARAGVAGDVIIADPAFYEVAAVHVWCFREMLSLQAGR